MNKPTIDAIRHGYRRKSDRENDFNKKKSEEFWFRPKYKAERIDERV